MGPQLEGWHCSILGASRLFLSTRSSAERARQAVYPHGVLMDLRLCPVLPALVLTGVVCLYLTRYAFNIIFNILNKSSLNAFPCPWFISAMQLSECQPSLCLCEGVGGCSATHPRRTAVD